MLSISSAFWLPEPTFTSRTIPCLSINTAWGIPVTAYLSCISLWGDHGSVGQLMLGDEFFEHVHFIFEFDGCLTASVVPGAIIPSHVVLTGDSHNREPLVLVLLIEMLQMGECGDTRATPYGPKVD